MDAGPMSGWTATTAVPGPAAARALRPMRSVIDAEVLGLTTWTSTGDLRGPFRSAPSRLPPERAEGGGNGAGDQATEPSQAPATAGSSSGIIGRTRSSA